MGTKSCTKILNFSTRFSGENLAVEDFVTLLIDGEILCLGMISEYGSIFTSILLVKVVWDKISGHT